MRQTQIINLTPHAITLVCGKLPMTIPSSGVVARVSSHTEVIGNIGDIPITRTAYSAVEGLPEPEEDTIYIVSALVAQRVPERGDVFIPNESVRDENGRIIGCKSLARIG